MVHLTVDALVNGVVRLSINNNLSPYHPLEATLGLGHQKTFYCKHSDFIITNIGYGIHLQFYFALIKSCAKKGIKDTQGAITWTPPHSLETHIHFILANKMKSRSQGVQWTVFHHSKKSIIQGRISVWH